MQEIKLLKFTFKHGKKQSWIDWCNELQRRSGEVMESLKAEGVRIEACFISEQENACYYLMQAGDLEESKNVSAGSDRKIDSEHAAMRLATLDFVEKLTPLFYFHES